MALRLPRLCLNGQGMRQLLESAGANNHLPEPWRTGLRFLQPSLFSGYRRHYFVSGDAGFRLTIDSELSFARPRNATPWVSNLSWPIIILELKFAPGLAEAAPPITNAFPFRVVRCSKYVLGLERVGI